MSLLNEHIEVRATTKGHPAFFTWRGRLYRVRRVIGTWSDGPQGSVEGTVPAEDAGTRFVRVAAESDDGEANIADLTLDRTTDHWTMRRLWT